MTVARVCHAGSARTATSIGVTAFALALTGCGGQAGGGLPDSPGVRPSPSVETTGHPALWSLAPLTGLPASSIDAAKRPVVSVVIAMDPGAPAPAGLDLADVVYEQARPG